MIFSGQFLEASLQHQTVKKKQHLPNKYKKILVRNHYFVCFSMQHIQGISGNQQQVSSLEDTISADNPVRFIDAFVNSINLEKLEFTTKVLQVVGRPIFDTKVFLKIYLYGYLKGIRSSRRLKKEPSQRTSLLHLAS